MGELFPVLAGVCIGFVLLRIPSLRTRGIALVVLSLCAGFTASLISGELFVSWDFLFFDVPLVLLGAVVTTFVLTWQAQRSLLP
jgi:hypothetical protein